MDRIVSMTCFAHVVDSGSFTSAARRLDMSAAMVTNHIQSLEERFGVRLLNRTTRKVSLTDEGVAFYESCTRILAEVEEAESSVSALQSKPRGTVRLNTSVSLARLVTPLIGEYVEAYPEVSFEMIMTDRMVDLVEERFDLALRVGPLPDSSLITRRMGLGQLILCASPAYLARRPPPKRPEDLVEHNCLIHVNSFIERHWCFVGPDGEHEIEVSGNLRSNSIEGLRAAALAGQGVCLLPRVNITDDLGAGRLTQLLTEFKTSEAIIHAVYPAGRHLSIKVRTFLDFLVGRLCDTASEPVRALSPRRKDAAA